MRNPLDMLYDAIISPAKEGLKEELLKAMDKCARILIVTQRLGEEMNIFDSATYTDILNRYARTHFEATKGMGPEELMEYMSGGDESDSQNI